MMGVVERIRAKEMPNLRGGHRDIVGPTHKLHIIEKCPFYAVRVLPLSYFMNTFLVMIWDGQSYLIHADQLRIQYPPELPPYRIYECPSNLYSAYKEWLGIDTKTLTLAREELPDAVESHDISTAVATGVIPDLLDAFPIGAPNA